MTSELRRFARPLQRHELVGVLEGRLAPPTVPLHLYADLSQVEAKVGTGSRWVKMNWTSG